MWSAPCRNILRFSINVLQKLQQSTSHTILQSRTDRYSIASHYPLSLRRPTWNQRLITNVPRHRLFGPPFDQTSSWLPILSDDLQLKAGEVAALSWPGQDRPRVFSQVPQTAQGALLPSLAGPQFPSGAIITQSKRLGGSWRRWVDGLQREEGISDQGQRDQYCPIISAKKKYLPTITSGYRLVN